MADSLNMGALSITVYIITVLVCLGLIAYVVRGWHKRVRHTSHKLKRFPE